MAHAAWERQTEIAPDPTPLRDRLPNALAAATLGGALAVGLTLLPHDTPADEMPQRIITFDIPHGLPRPIVIPHPAPTHSAPTHTSIPKPTVDPAPKPKPSGIDIHLLGDPHGYPEIHLSKSPAEQSLLALGSRAIQPEKIDIWTDRSWPQCVYVEAAKKRAKHYAEAHHLPRDKTEALQRSEILKTFGYTKQPEYMSVGVNHGKNFTPNTCFADLIKIPKQVGYYVMISYPGYKYAKKYDNNPLASNGDRYKIATNYGIQAARSAMQIVYKAGAQAPHKWTIDVESPERWEGNGLEHQKVIAAMYSVLEQSALTDIYTSPYKTPKKIGLWHTITDYRGVPWKPGYPVWIVTGTNNAKAAKYGCTDPKRPSPTGGPITDSQFTVADPKTGIDTDFDVPCGVY